MRASRHISQRWQHVRTPTYVPSAGTGRHESPGRGKPPLTGSRGQRDRLLPRRCVCDEIQNRLLDARAWWFCVGPTDNGMSPGAPDMDASARVHPALGRDEYVNDTLRPVDKSVDLGGAPVTQHRAVSGVQQSCPQLRPAGSGPLNVA